MLSRSSSAAVWFADGTTTPGGQMLATTPRPYRTDCAVEILGRRTVFSALTRLSLNPENRAFSTSLGVNYSRHGAFRSYIGAIRKTFDLPEEANRPAYWSLAQRRSPLVKKPPRKLLRRG